MKLSASSLLELAGHSSFPTQGIREQLQFLARKHGQELALGGINRPWLSYAGLAELVERQSNSLLSAGIGRGSVVIMCLPNGPEAFTALLSLASV
jgi:non-ribosomal peptide synthetase component E (peptide arylation enzyme)